MYFKLSKVRHPLLPAHTHKHALQILSARTAHQRHNPVLSRHLQILLASALYYTVTSIGSEELVASAPPNGVPEVGDHTL